jgi:hypothetical protein
VIEQAEGGVKGSPDMQIERNSGESIPEAAVVAILDDIGRCYIWYQRISQSKWEVYERESIGWY